MPDTPLKAIIHAAVGRTRSVREFPTKAVEAYAFETALDTDTDNFSIDIGDPLRKLAILTNRDTEIRITIYNPNTQARLEPVFTGIADSAHYSSDDHVLSITGNDLSVLAQSDMQPQRWRHVQPAQLIAQRAVALGLSVNRINKMRQIGSLYTDGSETEWEFWYRIVRDSGFFIWTEPLGGLVVDHLGYSLRPSYNFGVPPRGAAKGSWRMPDRVEILSNKKRIGEVWVYAEDSKTGNSFIASGIDTSIRSWRNKPIKILTSSSAKSQADAKKQADEEIFESIVGAQEWELTFNDVGVVIKQNKMCRVNLPDLGISGNFFIVGVRSQGGADGKTQVVRLRERGYAISKRVPDAPVITTDNQDASDLVTTGSVADALDKSGIRWGDAFVRAANESGKSNGFDLAVFLGVLLAICDHETGFANVRQTHTGAPSHVEWKPLSQWGGPHRGNAASYKATFANEPNHEGNPFGGDQAGVGPMQLTTGGYKVKADEYGWNGTSKAGELDGGRWNPESNIRAAAWALAGKAKEAGVDPTKEDQIWIAVERYNGSGDAARAYRAKVKALYDSQYSGAAQAAINSAGADGGGVSQPSRHNYPIKGHGPVHIPDAAPGWVTGAIAFAMNQRGKPYVTGGIGPDNYDCSGLVIAAFETQDFVKDKFHGRGDTTYTLFDHGRFIDVASGEVQAGDMLFFVSNGTRNEPGHMGLAIDEHLMVVASSGEHKVTIQARMDIADALGWAGAKRVSQWSLGLPH
jgi:cell wall-associated NlpC family hydrolase/prophage tail gpP-like protein